MDLSVWVPLLQTACVRGMDCYFQVRFLPSSLSLCFFFQVVEMFFAPLLISWMFVLLPSSFCSVPSLQVFGPFLILFLVILHLLLLYFFFLIAMLSRLSVLIFY